eukprot:4371600-Prymnesium_polylepis.1
MEEAYVRLESTDAAVLRAEPRGSTGSLRTRGTRSARPQLRRTRPTNGTRSPFNGTAAVVGEVAEYEERAQGEGEVVRVDATLSANPCVARA